MECSCSRGKRRWRWCGSRSRMVKLAAGLCFAVAIIWACSAVLLRSESWGRGRAAASCGNQGCYDIINTGGQKQGQWQWQWRRLLADGPGSYPPRCTSKCGDCNPCYPVHVAVPPGVPVTTEYYPEAWRCKCGNRLYMP